MPVKREADPLPEGALNRDERALIKSTSGNDKIKIYVVSRQEYNDFELWDSEVKSLSLDLWNEYYYFTNYWHAYACHLQLLQRHKSHGS